MKWLEKLEFRVHTYHALIESDVGRASHPQTGAIDITRVFQRQVPDRDVVGGIDANDMLVVVSPMHRDACRRS